MTSGVHATSADASVQRYHVDELERFAGRVLCAAGLAEGEAAVCAESLVQADARGIPSHGLSRLRTYCRRLHAGVVAAGVEPRIVQESPSALCIDGGNGMGMSIGRKVMNLCIERARDTGACFAAVRRANHFGIASYFTMQAAGQGMIGLAMCNAPASMVPTGGRRPMLGTNPLSIAIPAGRRSPFVLDMATSEVSQGKVILAANGGPRHKADRNLDTRFDQAEAQRATDETRRVLDQGPDVALTAAPNLMRCRPSR